MDLRPGALLGLPPGVPSVVFDVAYWRDLLVLLALAVGWAVARRRHGWALALAIAWAVLALGFWTFAMGRPYGVLQDPAATRWAAEVSVAAHAGGEDGFLAGEPPLHRRWAAASRRVGARPLLLAPTLLPLAVYPAIALLIAFLWGRPRAALAAILWMAVSTLDLDAVRGIGLLPALWATPASRGRRRGGDRGDAGRRPLAVAAARGGGRRGGRRRHRLRHRRGRVTPTRAADVPGVLLLDAAPWVALGLIGLWSRRDPAALGLAAGGSAALLLAAVRPRRCRRRHRAVSRRPRPRRDAGDRRLRGSRGRRLPSSAPARTRVVAGRRRGAGSDRGGDPRGRRSSPGGTLRGWTRWPGRASSRSPTASPRRWTGSARAPIHGACSWPGRITLRPSPSSAGGGCSAPRRCSPRPTRSAGSAPSAPSCRAAASTTSCGATGCATCCSRRGSSGTIAWPSPGRIESAGLPLLYSNPSGLRVYELPR